MALNGWLPRLALNRSLFLFSLSVNPHSPAPYAIREWWTSSTRLEGDLESPLPEMGNRRWLVGCDTGQVQWRFAIATPVWVYRGDVHFSQDHCPPPPPSYIP